MLLHKTPHVGYVVKRYPRYSETFIVNEILAHEASGLEVEVFSLRPPIDTHFQDAIARVRAPVTYLPERTVKSSDFWSALEEAALLIPGFWATLEDARGHDAQDVYQAVVLASHVQRKGITHLHAHFGTSATSVALLAARFAGVPFTFTAHAKDIYHESICAEDLRRKLTMASSVITVSDYNVSYLRRVFGPAASGVYRIYNGLDLSVFDYKPPCNRQPAIVAVGRLIEKKGFADLISACALLRRRGVVFQCRIIGTGPLEPDLRKQIDELGLQGIVELVGPRAQGELIKLVRQAALMAVPCVEGADGNRDGLPTVLLEAMALGTPCVATPVTGIPEVIQDGETGLLVPEHDPAAIADAAQSLLQNRERRVYLATNARRLIEAEFDVRHTSEQIRHIFLSAGVQAIAAD